MKLQAQTRDGSRFSTLHFCLSLVLLLSVPTKLNCALGALDTADTSGDELFEGGDVLRATAFVERRRWEVKCSNQYAPRVDGCHPQERCARVVRDGFLDAETVEHLIEIAEKGMEGRDASGGPTIMDANSGYVKDGDGLVNIYQHPTKKKSLKKVFNKADYALYRRVIEKIRLQVIEEFALSTLYFTAPTFITRIVGNSEWEPKDLHDEYWHPHVDKNNTPHYDYSGLVYLSTRGKEFTGGLFTFIDEGGAKNTTIEPASGRLLVFSSGHENLHQVRKVESGTRYVMSMWFTCDERREFKNFLDGKVHRLFNGIKDVEANSRSTTKNARRKGEAETSEGKEEL